MIKNSLFLYGNKTNFSYLFTVKICAQAPKTGATNFRKPPQSRILRINQK